MLTLRFLLGSMLSSFSSVIFLGFHIDNRSTDLFYSFHLTFESLVECLTIFPCSFMRWAINKTTVEMFLSGMRGRMINWWLIVEINCIYTLVKRGTISASKWECPRLPIWKHAHGLLLRQGAGVLPLPVSFDISLPGASIPGRPSLTDTRLPAAGIYQSYRSPVGHYLLELTFFFQTVLIHLGLWG